jgi:hypothetical protein
MATEKQSDKSELLDKLLKMLLGLPWMEIVAELLVISRKLWQGMPYEGIYEVLEHDARLELEDRRGMRAQVHKRQKVRYLQNDTVAFQDQAWGDGEILIDYKCIPGREVDRWRPGQKTYILISLRDSKRRDDIDEHKISWRMRNGFLRKRELWETEVSHKTRRLSVAVTFPKTRPPQRVWLVEVLQRRRQVLDGSAQTLLPDGRWLVYWETYKPRLNERYQLHWEW